MVWWMNLKFHNSLLDLKEIPFGIFIHFGTFVSLKQSYNTLSCLGSTELWFWIIWCKRNLINSYKVLTLFTLFKNKVERRGENVLGRITLRRLENGVVVWDLSKIRWMLINLKSRVPEVGACKDIKNLQSHSVIKTGSWWLPPWVPPPGVAL